MAKRYNGLKVRPAAENTDQSSHLASRCEVGSMNQLHMQQKRVIALHCAQVLQPTHDAEEGNDFLHTRVCSLRAEGKYLGGPACYKVLKS